MTLKVRKWEEESQTVGGKNQKWRKRKGQSKHFMLHRRGSWSFRFLFPNSHIKQCCNRNLIIPMAYLPFPSPPANKDTEKLEDRSCITTKIWLLQINRTTALSPLSLPGTVLGARWDQWQRYMDYPAWLGCRVGSMKDTHCVKPDKRIFQ